MSKILLPVLLLVATFIAYEPAWNGKPVWDDDGHITKPELRSVHGLVRIWVEPGATQQYYPLTHSVFWLEYKLWGESSLGYHLVNILLHVLSALLVMRIMRRLEIPGAWLAAFIFALHPVHVESVAWISELKNTLSGVFYLAAFGVYLGFDRTRRGKLYAAALVLFILGLLSKSVVSTLPAALLVIFWWKRGRLSWKGDIAPLIPFFVAGIGAGLFTAWVERHFIGAQGGGFDFTLIERCMIAGRAFWFYLGKLFWPLDLIFIYPRWHISQGLWWQYLFPLGAIALLGLGVWFALVRRQRGFLAGLLFFAGSLFPALGFVNVYPFVYSFVADHFQYLASLGVIAMVCAAAARLAAHWKPWARWGASAALAACLAALSWLQAATYTDPETLYRATLRKNPDCWLADEHLALIYRQHGRFADAVALGRNAVKLRPNDADAINNLGLALCGAGKLAEGIGCYQTAIRFRPEDAGFRNNLGLALGQSGDLAGAVDQFHRALDLRPDSIEIRGNLANAYQNQGRKVEAITEYREIIRLKPDLLGARDNLAAFLAQDGRLSEAISIYRHTLRIQKEDVTACNGLAWLLATSPAASVRDGAAAVGLAENANRLRGGIDPAILDTLAAAYAEAGRFPDALESAGKALNLASGSGQDALAAQIRERVRIYQSGSPFRDSVPIDLP